MAFKLRQQRTEEQRIEDDIQRRRAASDRDLVAAVRKELARTGKGAPRLARGRMKVTRDIRKGCPGFNDIITKATPVAQPDRAFDLILFGERADLFEASVMKTLDARHEAAIDAASEDPSADTVAAADAVRVEVEIEGSWNTRWWKDRHGAWRNARELLVARWALIDSAGTPGAPAGWLPEVLSTAEA